MRRARVLYGDVVRRCCTGRGCWGCWEGRSVALGRGGGDCWWATSGGSVVWGAVFRSCARLRRRTIAFCHTQNSIIAGDATIAAERRENERGAEKSEAEHFFSYTHQAHTKAYTSGGLNIRRNNRAKKRRGVKTGGCAEQDKVLGALPTILKRVLYERVGTIAYTGEKVRL